MSKPVFTLVPDTARASRVVAMLADIREEIGTYPPRQSRPDWVLPAGSLSLVTQRVGRIKRRPRLRGYRFVFDGAQAPARIRFDESAKLREIPWGKRDAALGATVCGELPKVMPASGKGFGEPWKWNPRVYVPRWIGYAGVAVLVIGALAGMAR